MRQRALLGLGRFWDGQKGRASGTDGNIDSGATLISLSERKAQSQ